jgi:hypothetical protein
MATEATTTAGSRTFQDGVQISWTPSTTTNAVDVQISIGGSTVWDEQFQGNGTENVNATDDKTYKMTGTLAVTFSTSGSGGKLEAQDLKWTVEGSSHGYNGLVGVW